MTSIKNIAIVGSGGNLGRVIADTLVKSGKFHVTAITRPDSKATIPQGLGVEKTDYTHESLVKALRGQDALVITMSVMAPPDSQVKLIDAALEAGVKYIIPSEWGVDPVTMAEFSKDIHLWDRMIVVRNHLVKTGANWIAIACSFWYEYGLAAWDAQYGFDFQNKTVTLYDEGDTKINTSTWPQVARAVAAVLQNPTEFRNRSVTIKSFHVSQKDMLASVERVTGEKWTVKKEPARERYERGVNMMEAGTMPLGFVLAMYARAFFPDDSLSLETENQALALPEEDLDAATKVAIGMVQ